MREVVAECERPVMLYSIGKDSSVMLHLALKAFYPVRPPFPFLHVDTTWKFREMITFREETAQRLGLDLRVHINPEGLAMGINPFDDGSSPYTDVMKTQALKRRWTSTASMRRSGARGGTKKNRGRRSGCSPSAPRSIAGIRSCSARNCGTSTTHARKLARASGSFPFPTGPSSTSGGTSTPRTFRSFRCVLRPGTARRSPQRNAHHGG